MISRRKAFTLGSAALASSCAPVPAPARSLASRALSRTKFEHIAERANALMRLWVESEVGPFDIWLIAIPGDDERAETCEVIVKAASGAPFDIVLRFHDYFHDTVAARLEFRDALVGALKPIFEGPGKFRHVGKQASHRFEIVALEPGDVVWRHRRSSSPGLHPAVTA